MITTDRVKAITAVALVLTLCAAWNTVDRLQLLLMLPVPMVRGGAVAISNSRNTLAIVFSLLFSWGRRGAGLAGTRRVSLSGDTRAEGGYSWRPRG